VTSAAGTVVIVAHAGAGSSWQAMVVVAALGLALAVVLATLRVIDVGAPDDLVMPLAASAVASSLGAALGHAWLSDWIGWAIPLGVVSLSALALAALTPLSLTRGSPLPYAAAVLAAVGIIAFQQPLTRELHPPADLTPVGLETADPHPSPASAAGTGRPTGGGAHRHRSHATTTVPGKVAQLRAPRTAE